MCEGRDVPGAEVSGLDREFGEPVGGREPRRFKREKRGKGVAASCWNARTSKATPGIERRQSVPRDAPLRPGDSPGRMPGDRPVRPDDIYETDEDTKNREFREWNAKSEWGRTRETLTDEEVREIRELAADASKRIGVLSESFKSSDNTRREIARRFGIGTTLLYKILRGSAYGDVK